MKTKGKWQQEKKNKQNMRKEKKWKHNIKARQIQYTYKEKNVLNWWKKLQD